jgi:hypothetical protein
VTFPALTEEDIKRLNRHRCADCSAQLTEGPHGGGSINYHCSQGRCGSRFNLSIGWERISEPSPNERTSR